MAIGAAVGAIVGAVSSVAANRQQRKAARAERRQAQVRNIRERRQALAQSRISAAEALSQGTQTGAAGGSALAGAIGSLQTQTAANIGFQNQLNALNNQRLSALDRAASIQAFGSAAQQLGQAAGSFAQPSGSGG